MVEGQSNYESFEKVLSSTLVRTIDLLKFAEAKNLALLTFSSVWALAAANTLNSLAAPAPFQRSTLALSLLLFSVAILVAFWSLLPKRKADIFQRDPNQPKNFLFYGHIAEFDVSAFRERAKERYLGEEDISHNYMTDLSDQVAIVSKIADRKFALFNRGAAAAFLGMITFGLAPLYAWLHIIADSLLS